MEQEEYQRLALQQLDAVYRLAYFLCNQSQEADDAVQETYLRAFKAGERFTLSEHGLRPWLFKILHNVVTARAIKEHRQPSTGGGHLDNPAAEVHLDTDLPVTEVSKIDWETVDERMKRAKAGVARSRARCPPHFPRVPVRDSGPCR